MLHSVNMRIPFYVESGHCCVSMHWVQKIAAEDNLPLREVEINLLANELVPARYIRNIGTFGIDGQIKLLQSHAAVVGCGGLGGWIVELLARSGVGELRVIDGDHFTDNNLNRQNLCTEDTLGKNKALVAAERIYALNKAIKVNACPVMMDEHNAAQLIENCNVVFDALDNIPSRKKLLQVAQKLQIPLIHGAIAGYWGQLYTALPDDENLALIWEGKQEKGIEIKTGNPPFTPAALASLQVCEGIKLLIQKDQKKLNPCFLSLDLKEMTLDFLC